jgi:hypothetical protein
MNVSALPFRSHNLIFNDWFRDENLQPSLAVPVNDGPDSQSDYNIERSRKRKDYFTGEYHHERHAQAYAGQQ